MEQISFYQIKKEIRVLGVDDAPFHFHENKTTPLVGAVFRGGDWIDGVLRTDIEIDGKDATEKLAEMIKKTKFKDLRIVMLDGLGFGGFNLVNIKKLFEETGLGVIVVVRRKPDFDSIHRAIQKLEHRNYYQKCIKEAGKPRKIQTRRKKHVYIQFKGLSFQDASQIVKMTATRSLIPEPIRAAHLIAQGFVLGESRGSA